MISSSGKKVKLTIDFVNEIVPAINNDDISRTSFDIPHIYYTISVDIIDSMMANWLYVVSCNKSVGSLINNFSLVPFRLDALSVKDAYFVQEENRMVWTVEELIEERLTWKIASKVLVINTNESYGGIVDFVSGSQHVLITSSPYDHRTVYESTFLTPLVKGRFITHERRGREFVAKIEIDAEEFKRCLTS